MAEVAPSFDPSKPYDVVGHPEGTDVPAFDAAKPFDVVSTAPAGTHEVANWARPGVGFMRGTADILGAPVDAAASLIRPRVWESLTPEQKADFAQRHPVSAASLAAYSEGNKAPIGGSESIKGAMGLVGANPNDVAPATTATQHVLEAAGSGAASMVVPGMGAEAALARSSAASDSFGRMALEILKGSGPVSNAVIGGASGAGGEIAAEAAPDRFKNLARLGWRFGRWQGRWGRYRRCLAGGYRASEDEGRQGHPRARQ